MLIDLVYQTVLTIANSDVRGNVKPSDARLLINTTVEEIYESYFYELNRMLNRQNKGLVGGGLSNIPDLIREKIYHYLEEKEINVVDGSVSLPDNLRFLEGVLHDDSEVEILKDRRGFGAVKSLASATYPIGYKISENTLKVFPIDLDKVSVSYLRTPKLANWTFIVVGGAEMFNPSSPDFQELDIHPSELYNVIILTLQKVGINLKEQDLQQIMQQQKTIEFNQEMQS